jgi:xanthine dehydrogenase YagT iron-sulfur-binding subunit
MDDDESTQLHAALRYENRGRTMNGPDEISKVPSLEPSSIRLSRREVLGTGALGAGVAIAAASLPASTAAQSVGDEIASLPFRPAYMLNVQMIVNGREFVVDIDARTSLLDLLRERLHLTGAKKGCDHGQCGACTGNSAGGAKRLRCCVD